MGADVIGWRDCELQAPLGPGGFHQKLKMRAYARAVESQVPEGKRAGVKLTVIVNDRERDLTYEEVRAAADSFERGIPECATCPLSEGAPLGCYQYVTYPIDARFEEVAFEFFTSNVGVKDSICDQLYRDIVSKQPTSGSGWHTRRGPQGPLARLPVPLTYSWGGFFSKKRVDSAQLCASLFVPLSSPALVVGYARFWGELVAFAQRKLDDELVRRGLEIKPDGKLIVKVTGAQVANLAEKLGADAAALEALIGGTFSEARSLARMLRAAAPRSVDSGWTVVVDA